MRGWSGARAATTGFPNLQAVNTARSSLSAALDDLNASAEGGLEPGESLAEAEDEIGIADWIDPDTGVPAEEGVPRRGAE